MAQTYYYTVGLEIHAELKTNTKMFCGCKNDPDEKKPNVNICPVCMAHPGTLPVINKKAIEQVIKVGLALGANIADFTEFDRKNYFYPDIPKGYQISQYKFPIVSGGRLADMDITRVHLEEDTANNKHFADPAGGEAGYSLIDFNRSGVPLMELVTEPHTFSSVEEAAKTASNFAKEYQLILWYLGASEANMEKGEMRVEANVSVSPDKNKKSSAYVEVKNLNSFRSVERAIKYEVERMTKLWEEGKESEIVKETRGWDENKQKTISQRSKENANDYRYFPDPDLPKLKLHEAFDIETMKKALPELPEMKRVKYKNFGMKDDACEIFINDKEFGDWFEKEVIPNLSNEEEIVLAANFAVNDIQGYIQTTLLEGTTRLPNALKFSKIVKMYKDARISSRGAKDMLGYFATNVDFFNEDPEEFAKTQGLLQESNEGALKEIVQKIISENAEVVASYKSGKENAIMSLVGKVIKESGGSANPQMVITLLKEMLK